MSDKLNPRQREFAFYYAKHGNGTQAAIDAGYSERTAHTTASRLIKNDEVAKEIQRLHKAKLMGPDEVLIGLAEIARLDMDDFATVQKDGGARLNLRKAKKARKMNMIRELQTETEARTDGNGDETVRVTRTKVKLYDRQRALETIAKHHGLLNDRLDININVNINLVVEVWHKLENAGLDPVKALEGLGHFADEYARKLH